VGKRELFNGIVNRIQAVGVELEGGWDTFPKLKDFRQDHDGSVRFKEPRMIEQFDAGGRRVVVPEPGSPPYPKWIGELVMYPPKAVGQAAEWITRCYPPYVNETCGLHVHMSFYYKLNYSRLMTPEYTTQMIQEIRAWGERNNIPTNHALWRRLDPRDEITQQHCAHIFLGDKQAAINKKDYSSRGKAHSRYTAINYCALQHNTVECRILPMFEKPEQAVSAVHCVIDTTNRFLSKMRQRERAVKTEVLVQPPIEKTISRIVY
jgi:hypothetical protein